MRVECRSGGRCREGRLVERASVTRKARAFPAWLLLAVALHGLVQGVLTGRVAAADSPADVARSDSDVRPTAVATFHNMSLYWPRADGRSDRPVRVQYRRVGVQAWSSAQDLDWDPKLRRYAGSVVDLEAGVEYEFRLAHPDGPEARFTRATWTEQFPIARTVTLPAGVIKSTYVITEGGDDRGYVLYQAHPAGTVIDVDPTNGSESDAADHGVRIAASKVILRGVVIRDAKMHGVFIDRGETQGRQDVVIEGCEITNWGRRNQRAGQSITVSMRNDQASADAGRTIRSTEANVRIRPDLGWHLDSGIRANGSEVARIVIQGNRIHTPRYTSNNWSEAAGEYFRGSLHPEGPKAVVLFDPGVDVPRIGNHVIRYNDIHGSDRRAFNDILFEGYGGSPALYANDAVADTDVYGNAFAHCWDDAIEIERAVANVRIYDNHFRRIYKPVSFHQDYKAASETFGPFYLFRNVFEDVWNQNRPPTRADPNPFYGDRYVRITGRTGAQPSLLLGRNRVYMYHNSFILTGDRGYSFALGLDPYLASVPRFESLAAGQPNLVSRNNILQTSTRWPFGTATKPNPRLTAGVKIAPPDGPIRVFDGDLHNGTADFPELLGSRAIRGVPIWRATTRPDGSDRFQLADDSPGLDAAIPLPNFNDRFNGHGPDVGAIESGTNAAVYGVRRWSNRR